MAIRRYLTPSGPAIPPNTGPSAAPISRWTLSCLAIVVLLAYGHVNSGPGAVPVVKGDGEGYYAYLPAYLIDHDPSFVKLVSKHKFPDPLTLSGLLQQPNGRYLDKYPYGVAALTLPLFLVGEGFTAASGGTNDGYSPQDQLLAGIAAALAAIGGLASLRLLLLRRFSDGATAGGLVCTLLGTSLLHYAAYDTTYSHAFSFGAVAVFALAAVRWAERPGSGWRPATLGVAGGTIVVLRPANLLLALALFPLALAGHERPGQRLRPIMGHWRQMLVVLLAAAPLVGLQLVVWRAAAGHWVLNPYAAGETFSFLHPHLEVLYSFNPHGLLPYAPVLLLSFAGLVTLWKQCRDWFWPVVTSLGLDTYLIASWHSWDYGVGFGHRGFVDALPVFAIPLTALFATVRAPWRRFALGTMAGLLTLTTLFGTLAYWRGGLSHQGASPTAYLNAVLGR